MEPEADQSRKLVELAPRVPDTPPTVPPVAVLRYVATNINLSAAAVPIESPANTDGAPIGFIWAEPVQTIDGFGFPIITHIAIMAVSA